MENFENRAGKKNVSFASKRRPASIPNFAVRRFRDGKANHVARHAADLLVGGHNRFSFKPSRLGGPYRDEIPWSDKHLPNLNGEARHSDGVVRRTRYLPYLLRSK
jgi:hypothetical protein